MNINEIIAEGERIARLNGFSTIKECADHFREKQLFQIPLNQSHQNPIVPNISAID